MNSLSEFLKQKNAAVEAMSRDSGLQQQATDFIRESATYNYSYHFEALGRPIIQFPQDMVAVQELIWQVKPDLIVETGIAHGGSLALSASMLALLDLSDAIKLGVDLNPAQSNRRVLGVDIDIREHNRMAIESHPMASRIEMIEGSSVDPEVIEKIHKFAAKYQRVMVFLDSNHTHEHVLAELKAYAPLTSVGSYCIVFDTVIADMPSDFFPNKTWGCGDNPRTAVKEYLLTNPSFEVDRDIHNKLLITVAPGGYLRRIAE